MPTTDLPLTAVTGATGQLGHLVVEELLARGVAPASLVAVVRSPERAADLAALGVDVRQGDYDDAAGLTRALAGVQQVLLVSGNEFGKRVEQHTHVVEAAQAAGVERVVYTSILQADTTANPLAPEHLATEQVIAATDLRHAFLRNGWYSENYTGQIATQREHGVAHATGGHPLDLATRQDFAAAAAAVLVDGTDGVYELAGAPVTMAGYAAELGRQTGSTVAVHDLSEDQLRDVLLGAGMPAEVAALFAEVDTSIAAGELSDGSGTLEKLLGRPATPIADTIAAALASA